MPITLTLKEWKAVVDAELAQCFVFSPGLTHICSECCDTHNYPFKSKRFERDIQTQKVVDEGGFSRSGCDLCPNSLGTNLFAAHMVVKQPVKRNGKDTKRTKLVIYHYDICQDCMCYVANGDLPEGYADEEEFLDSTKGGTH